MKKQSSIEWLVEELSRQTRLYTKEEIIDQAKEMHKQEIIEACEEFLDITLPIEVYKEYYENTYEKES